MAGSIDKNRSKTGVKNSQPHINGMVCLNSDLTIEELGTIIGNKLFAGAVFGGKEKHIYDEVPAIFIKDLIVGNSVILQGSSQDGYALEIISDFDIRINSHFKEVESYSVNMDDYLYALLEENLKDYSEIEVKKPWDWKE